MSDNYYKIPVTSAPNQLLRLIVPINGKNITLRLFLSFNSCAGYWTMAISNDDGTPLVTSLPLFGGCYPAANLLEQYRYLQIGSAYLVKVNQDIKSEYPGPDNLGTDFILVWGDNIE